MIITRNDWTCLPILLWSSTVWRLLQGLLSFCMTKPVHSGNNFNKAPVLQKAIAMNTNSAFTGLYTENSLWYQQFDLRQIRILRGDLPSVEIDAANNG